MSMMNMANTKILYYNFNEGIGEVLKALYKAPNTALLNEVETGIPNTFGG